MWGVFRRKDGTEKLIARSRSKTAAHDYAERLEEDWDDPSGATYTYREIRLLQICLTLKTL